MFVKMKVEPGGLWKYHRHKTAVRQGGMTEGAISSFYYNVYYEIWRPDIVLYNNVGDKIEVNTLIQVYY